MNGKSAKRLRGIAKRMNGGNQRSPCLVLPSPASLTVRRIGFREILRAYKRPYTATPRTERAAWLALHEGLWKQVPKEAGA